MELSWAQWLAIPATQEAEAGLRPAWVTQQSLISKKKKNRGAHII
jgi:hypothetical protein